MRSEENLLGFFEERRNSHLGNIGEGSILNQAYPQEKPLPI